MRRLILIAAMSAMVLAKPKPETYRESEDFQYSRSSSDDGTKSGYYGAQRGNMGGNYERAHNMDNLAQHQMSGLVRQVDGELGEGARTRTGSVYTAANSRGIYGSGSYDLSNLKGRNFAEGESLGTSQSHLSQTSQNSGYTGYSYGATNSAGFSSSSHAQNSRYSGYQSAGHADQSQIDNLQTTDMSQGHSRYDNDNQARYNMRQHTQYGSHGQNEFEQSSSNVYGSRGFNGNSQTRYITTPERVVLRPGTTVRFAIPITAPAYDLAQNSRVDNKNTINTDAEVLTQQTNLKPTNKVKHYESSYSYKKQWEKHNTQPAEVSVVVPTENPFPKNSELYEDAQLLQSSKNQFASTDLHSAHSSNVNNEQRAHTSGAASQSRMQSGFNTQQSHSGFSSQHRQAGYNAQQSNAASDSYASTYGQGAQQSGMAADLTNAVANGDLKPKSYQSSYSYHKSWERQGDPYVIIPTGAVSNGQASQRLTAGTSNSAAYTSRQYGSHSRQAHQTYLADCDCDEEGHVRVARSYTPEEEQQVLSQFQQGPSNHENLEDLGQQTQSQWGNIEDLGQQQQQNKWDNLQDLGQQTQNQWDNLQQLGQETQNQWDNLQQLGQQTQNQWDNLQQLGQQTEDKWDKLEDLGQQTQRDLEQSQNENLDFTQHNQKEDVLKNFEQQSNGEDINVDQKTYTQQETRPISTSWDQTPDFDIQSNKESTDNINMHHVTGFDQHQQNPWVQIQDQNTNFDHFMKPTTGLNNNFEHNFQKHTIDNFGFNVNEKPNHLPLPTVYTGSNSYTPNNDQESFFNINQNYNTFNHGHHSWHTNEQHNNQFEHNFHSNSFSTSNTDTSIQGLWDNIDEIAKEFSVTNDKPDQSLPQGNSNFHMYNQNDYHMQNGFHHGYIPRPTYPHFIIPQVNIDKNKETDTGKHQLFEEETQTTSTTMKPNKVQTSYVNPIENGDTTFNSQDKRPFNHDQNVHSKDEGRGDIGPEDALNEFVTENKPEKTPEEIESLSMTKETNPIKPDGPIIQLNPMNNFKDDGTPHSLIPATLPTTPKSDNFHNVYPKATTDAVDLPLPQIPPVQNHKPPKNTVENDDIPQNIPQLNLEQFLNNFSQEEKKSSSGDNLQEGFDRQNVEQQYEVFRQPEIEEPHKITQQNTNVNEQHPLLSTFELHIPSSTPATQISTTLKSNNVYTGNQKPYFDVLTLDNNPLIETPNKPKEQTTECVETPEDLEQQNLEQQFVDTWDQQLQGSWAGENLQQGFDQQNMEQQFEVFNQPETGKTYKNPQEIESLSLTNLKPETNIEKETINKQSVQENTNNNEQLTLFSTFQSRIPSSTPLAEVSTTIKSIIAYSVDQKHDIHNQQEQTTECVETPKDIQEQDLEQFVNNNWDQQSQGSWAGDDLQHGYDQQNMEQQFEVFQQHENMHGLQTSLQNFDQQAQSSLQSFDDVQQIENKETESLLNNYEQKYPPPVNSRDVNEEPIHPVYISHGQGNSNEKDLENSQKTEDIQSSPEKKLEPVTPVETISEKPGFWKSVGSKLSNAKDKVYSWFKSS